MSTRITEWNYRNFLYVVRTSPAIIARTTTSIPGKDAREGVNDGPGVVVTMTVVVVGGGVVIMEVIVTVAGDCETVRVALVVGTVVIITGTPSSTATFVFATVPGFSTLMENVRVAVLKDVWKATTARPFPSVVTRA